MDRIKIGFEYLKLGFLYIILLIIRLLCFVSIKDIDTEWFRKKMHEVPIFLGTILTMVLIFIDKEYLIVLYILPIFVFCYLSMGAIVLISVFFCEVEYLLDVFLRKKLESNEERFGRKKDKIKIRKFCFAAKETSYNFFGYGWILAICISIIIILYFQTIPDVGLLEMRAGQTFGAFITVIGFGWKKRSYYYANRQHNEYRERKEQKNNQNSREYTYQDNTYRQEDEKESEHSPIACGYFNGCTNMKDVKKIYHDMARTLHPDAGGDPDKFRMLKEEYEYVRKKWNEK